MKYLALILALFVFTGCGTASNPFSAEIGPIAVKSIEHGYAEHYSPDRLESLKKSGNRFAIFAGENWCPGCRRLAEQIIANQSMLPKNTVILIADFDAELELRRQYGLTMKHAGIFFDENGEHQETMLSVRMSDFMAHLSGIANTKTR